MLSARLLSLMPSAYQMQSWRSLLATFLRARGRVTLDGAVLSSKGALSRFLNRYAWDTARCWQELNKVQWNALLGRRKEWHAELQLIVDTTSIPRTGKQFPLAFFFHETFGVHVVVLYAVFRELRFPIGMRVYHGKGTPSQTTLALELLRAVPPRIRMKFKCWVLADAAFSSAVFLRSVLALGMQFAVGVQYTRLLREGTPVWFKPHGARVELQNAPIGPLTLARVAARHQERFSVCSEAMSGDDVWKLGKKRWAIEVFFKTAKGRFGLSRCSLRTELGFERWLLLVFVAFTLAVLSAQPGQSLAIVARTCCEALFGVLLVAELLDWLQAHRSLLRQHGLQVTYAGETF